MKYKEKIYAITLTICFIIIVIVAFFYYITTPIKNNMPPLSDSNYFVAHATGSIEGYTYLNSKESLLQSLNNGYKYIEFDLQYTSDSIIVCVHNWEQFNKSTIPGITGRDTSRYKKIPSYKEFRSRKIYGKYTPLSLQDVISIQKQTDFTIVTDVICNAETLNNYFKKDIRKKIMVETFSKKDYELLKSSGYTPMLSLGCISMFNGGIKFLFSQFFKKDCEWIIVEQHSSKRTLRLLRKFLGIKIALFTVNSADFFSWHLGNNDVDLIYTDNWDLKRQLNNYQDNSTR